MLQISSFISFHFNLFHFCSLQQQVNEFNIKNYSKYLPSTPVTPRWPGCGLEYFTLCWMALAEGVGKVEGMDRRRGREEM